MPYLLAALRTVAILVGICVSIFVLILLIGGIVTAFLQSWLAGSVVLCLMCGTGALFGYQLYRFAKIDRTRLVGFVTCLAFGIVFAFSLIAIIAVPLETYLWSSAFLPVIKAGLGIQPPFGRTGHVVAVVVFLQFFVVAPIGLLVRFVRRPQNWP